MLRALAVLLVLLPSLARGAACGPTYGADGIAVTGDGEVVFTHFEDPRIGRFFPASGRFDEAATTDAAGLSGVALDARRGLVWSVAFDSGRLVRYATASRTFATIELGNLVLNERGGLALAADGSLWAMTARPAEDGLVGGRLHRVSAAGSVAETVALPVESFRSAVLTLDGKGRPWVAVAPQAGGPVGFWTLGRRGFRLAATVEAGPAVGGMAFDRSGRLWFTAPDRNAVGRIERGHVHWVALPSPDSVPVAVVAARDGAVWVTEWGARKLARIAPDGSLREYPMPPEEDAPLALAFGPDGVVWFSTLLNYDLFRLDAGTGEITTVAVPPPAKAPDGLRALAAGCPMPMTGAAVPAAPLPAARHPAGHPSDAAATFERRCNTECHTWYRVERAARRRTGWSATVDRMIEVNGAPVTAAERDLIVRYLDATYTAGR